MGPSVSFLFIKDTRALLENLITSADFSFVCVWSSAVYLSVIHNKDLLATLHLLVAMVRCFQPELDLPSDVKIEVVVVEVSCSCQTLALFLLLQDGFRHTLCNCCSLWCAVHPGQQKWNQIRCASGNLNRGKVRCLLPRVIL